MEHKIVIGQGEQHPAVRGGTQTLCEVVLCKEVKGEQHPAARGGTQVLGAAC